MDHSLFENAALSHVEKYKKVIDDLPIQQRKTYMNVAADIPISEFYLIADEVRRNNNFAVDEEYKAKIKYLVGDIVKTLFDYCEQY